MKQLSIGDSKNMQIAIHEEIQRSEDSKYDHRLHGVLMVLNGYDCYKVAELFAQHPTTIQRWVNDFNKNGFAGLMEGERAGRPKSLNDSQWKRLGEDLRKSPSEFNYDQSFWDGKLMSIHLDKKYKVQLGVRQCQRIFNMMGFRQRKPRPVIANANPEAQKAFKKTSVIGKE